MVVQATILDVTDTTISRTCVFGNFLAPHCLVKIDSATGRGPFLDEPSSDP